MELFEADLRTWADDWQLAGQAERTIIEYVDCVRKFHAWCAEQGVQTPTVRAAKSYLVQLQHRSRWSPVMTARAIKAWGKWFAGEYQVDDPYAALAFVRQPDPLPQRTTTVADVAALLLVCGTDMRGLRDRALIHVLASTGMRRTEVTSMMWGDVDMAAGTISVPKSKNRRPRTVRLDRDAQRALRRYAHALDAWELATDREPSEHVWVSTSRRRDLSSNGLGQILQTRSAEAGVSVSAHAFRRGFAVQWLRKGGSETHLRKMAGWQSPRMVERYVNAVAEEAALVEHERIFG